MHNGIKTFSNKNEVVSCSTFANFMTAICAFVTVVNKIAISFPNSNYSFFEEVFFFPS